MRSNLINDAPPSPSQDWGYEPQMVVVERTWEYVP
jgi:hypothetical protein